MNIFKRLLELLKPYSRTLIVVGDFTFTGNCIGASAAPSAEDCD